MAIVVCPACGKRYRVEQGLAGKRLRCGCGQPVEVGPPDQGAQRGSAEAAPQEDDDWVAAAFVSPEPPVAPQASEQQAPLPPPAPQWVSQEDPSDADAAAPGEPIEFSRDTPRDLLRHVQSAIASARKGRSKAAVRRLVVAGLAIAYGAVMALLLVIRLLLDPPEGIFGLSNRLASIVLAGCVAAGGWLILKRHPQGPAWAGLASLFLCFPSAWWLLMNVLGYYSTGQWRWLGAAVLQGVALFAIPAVVIAWCLQKELARQRRQQAMEDDELFHG